MNRSRARFVLVFIVLLNILVAFFVYPNGLGQKFLPWKQGLDLVGGSYLIYEIDMSNVDSVDQPSTSAGIRDVIERRVNAFGVAEPQITSAQVGDHYRLIVALAGIQDVKEAIKQIGATPFLYFAEVGEAEESAEESATTTLPLLPTNLTGKYLKRSDVTFDSISGRPQVNLTFNDEGAKIFEEITGRNVDKLLIVVLDDVIIQEAVVRQKIVGGRAQISGDFSLEEAQALTQRLNAGALPAPINLINQQTIGASLGSDSLQKSLLAGLIGTIIIMLFMILYYRLNGVVASTALIFYIILTAGVFKLFGITMSLAGIAGFLLSIGMAVDANILIFERTKEEQKRGVSKFIAIDEGFRRAWPSIRDSNITTIITSLILFFTTSSFVRGFALTLLIGVIVSMFSALTVSRIIFKSFIKEQGHN